MWPMLGAIGPVLGEGDLGAFETSDGARELWFYRAGKAGEHTGEGSDVISAEVKHPPFVLTDLPWVAVLMDRGTASSGEAIAISFARRPRERSFGEPTAGFSTANQEVPTVRWCGSFLCVAIDLDRTGRRYPDGVEPEVKLPAPGSRPAEEKDAVVQAAEDWITTQTGKSHPTY
jgi:carboxyl-terminal processing protease